METTNKNSSGITARAGIGIQAPAEKVWQALTDPAQIRQYFFGTNAESDWKEGSAVTFTGEWQGKAYRDKGTILKAEPNRLLRYTYWSSLSGIADKPENYVIITYELIPEEDGTLLTITQENVPDEKMRKHAEENWEKVLHNLKGLLERRQD
ncbi:MAG: SRPBCC family protein [Bacteroidota bacterium]